MYVPLPFSDLLSHQFLQLNEGTGFSSSVANISHAGQTEDQAFNNFIGKLILDNTTLSPATLAGIDALYPANDPANGAPFNTGDSLFDRGEAWYTDNMYLSPRRWLFDHGPQLSSAPFFGYFFTEFIPGNAPSKGGELMPHNDAT